MKKLLIILMLSAVLLASCAKRISEEEAKATAINFVNEKVRFTYIANSTKGVAKTAENTITGASIKDNEWHVNVYAESQVGENYKTALFTVVIDAETGKVKNLIQNRFT